MMLGWSYEGIGELRQLYTFWNLGDENMDAFDDFEMKPLTKGLGFHKKLKTYRSP